MIIGTQEYEYCFNTLRPKQNSCHFGHDNFKCIFLNAIYEGRFGYHCNMFLRLELNISQYWWLGAGQSTSYYLNQWCLVYRRIFASLSLIELNIYVHVNTLHRDILLVCCASKVKSEADTSMSNKYEKKYIIQQQVHLYLRMNYLWPNLYTWASQCTLTVILFNYFFTHPVAKFPACNRHIYGTYNPQHFDKNYSIMFELILVFIQHFQR